MEIMITCDCGNNVSLTIKEKKSCKFRDNLEQKGFRCIKENANLGDLKEIHIMCDKCKNRIALSLD